MSDQPCSSLGLLVQTACLWEVTARKVGNVHPSAEFTNTTYLDFVLSAAAIGHALHDAPARPVGESIVCAVQATASVCRSNTNLGMILLLAPLAAVSGGSLRSGLQTTLKQLTVDDARETFRAIRLANPGGLGDASEQDVRAEPTVTLLEAMKLAAERDQIAQQYANGFADVFDFGVPAFVAAFNRYECVEAAIVDSQLCWLAEHPDSLIARKNGPAITESVRRRAAGVLRLGGAGTAGGRRAGVALDRHLRSDGNKLNPGTTADLIAACLFVALRENKVSPSAPFRWRIEDWL